MQSFVHQFANQAIIMVKNALLALQELIHGVNFKLVFHVQKIVKFVNLNTYVNNVQMDL